MPHILSNGINIYYEKQGDGTPLLVISGTGSDLRNPRLPIPSIENDFSVLRYDQRGLGQTDVPPPPYSMTDYCNDAAALLSSLGIRQADVIGISFGGMVAQHLAGNHPDRVNKLVLACTSPGGKNYSSFDLQEIVKTTPSQQGEAWVRLLDSRYGMEEMNLPVISAVRELIKAGKPIFPNNLTSGTLNQLEARSTHDAFHLLETIEHPTLITGGLYDSVAPERNLREMHARIPNSQLALFEGGHLFLLQDQRAWPHIASFLLEDRGTLLV
ncbi:MAG: alpha/beta hydrolase [Actinomycetota bacterium]|nr:alpha/beta hydrolase [Actinomycetota bacterium]